MGAILTYKESNGASFAKINDEQPEFFAAQLSISTNPLNAYPVDCVCLGLI